MLDLSPTKLLIIFVVVVVLLGPKRLPEVARQLGAAWRKLREFHLHVDQELRQSLPDLPSSQDIVRFARSPVTLLNQLADRHDDPPSGHVTNGNLDAIDTLDAGSTTPGVPPPPVVPTPPSVVPTHPPVVPTLVGLDIDDPNLN
ncbi:MAG TPA: twin-arginine translocase TatA/TatE family subunit [Acidimicrobiales bacterium]|nr:twin-arginine translocase TatA/TatE family subunit [Acidimicrobiales bacterium]